MGIKNGERFGKRKLETGLKKRLRLVDVDFTVPQVITSDKQFRGPQLPYGVDKGVRLARNMHSELPIDYGDDVVADNSVVINPDDLD